MNLSKNLVREQKAWRGEGGEGGEGGLVLNAFDANAIINNDCKNKPCYY